jgi:hypothetical protein
MMLSMSVSRTGTFVSPLASVLVQQLSLSLAQANDLVKDRIVLKSTGVIDPPSGRRARGLQLSIHAIAKLFKLAIQFI